MEKVLPLLQSCHCWHQVSNKSIMTFSASRQSKTCWFRLVGEATRKYSCHRCWSWNWKEISLLIKKTVASSLRAGAACPVFISGAAHSPFSILDTHLVTLKTHSHLSCQADIVGSFSNKLNQDSLQNILLMIFTCLSERLLLRASRSQLQVHVHLCNVDMWTILYWLERANALNSTLNLSSIQETHQGHCF